ncbi:MAG: bifunctional heptose 7-phosphate kinase/heptose 1-phosphate adenyltransferase [bacterium]
MIEILKNISVRRIAVVGDFCLDAYWRADMTISELSRETPRFPLPIVEERYSPGGAGNVAWNLKDLGVATVYALGISGEDWRGNILRKEMEGRRIDLSFWLSSPEITTNAYIKPIRVGYETEQEDSRLDFENHKWMSRDLEGEFIERISKCISFIDGIVIVDQLSYGAISAGVRESLIDLARKYPEKVFSVDSRNRIGLYTDMILKPNEMEVVRAIDPEANAGASKDRQLVERCGFELARRSKKPLYVTLGEEGALLFEGEECHRIPALPVEGPIDVVGAGDTFLSAMSAGLCAGASFREAGFIGNAAASVTVKKLQQTGTATPEEIIERFKAVYGGGE